MPIGLPDDADDLLALQAEEIAVRMLPSLVQSRQEGLQLNGILHELTGHAETPTGLRPRGPYPAHRQGEVSEAVVEAWMWLEGQGLLIPTTPKGYLSATIYRKVSRRGVAIAASRNPHEMIAGAKMVKSMLHPEIRDDTNSR